MARPEVVCQPDAGLPLQVADLIESGRFDCPQCEPVMHVHLVPAHTPGRIGVDILVGHEVDCVIGRQTQIRAAGAANLN
jgi:hypothetical protein